MSDLNPPPGYGSVPPPPEPAPAAAAPVAAYASWLSRVGATLLDGLVGGALLIPFYGIGFGIIFASAELDPATGAPTGGAPNPLGFVFIGLGILISVGFLIWNTVFRQGRTGQTLGKKWVGIAVYREADGSVLGAGLAFGRYLLSSILTPVTLYLDVLWPLWDARKQTLHDKAVHTVVVKVS